MDLEALQTFVRVADHGSFTRAAQVLDVSRAVTSKRVRRLEERVEARLFTRTTRQIQLTEAGRDFLVYAREAVVLLEHGQDRLQRRQGAVAGSLRVALPMEFGRLCVVPHLPTLLREHPALQLDVQLEDRMIDYTTEQIDVGVRIGNVADSALVAQKLAPVHTHLVASPAYLAARGVPATPDALAAHDCLSYALYRGGRSWQLTRDGHTEPVAPRGRVRVDNSGALRTLVLAGCGIAELPDFLAREGLADGSLVQVLPDWSLPVLGIWAMYPDRRFLSPRVRVFVDFLREHLG